MRVGVAGMKGLLDRVAFHDFGGFPKGDLLLVEDESVGENLGHAFELVM